MPSRIQDMGEHDHVTIKEDQLFSGERSGDLSKERPKTLFPFSLAQKQAEK